VWWGSEGGGVLYNIMMLWREEERRGVRVDRSSVVREWWESEDGGVLYNIMMLWRKEPTITYRSCWSG
jgi:hypothetical protein